jgi:hypothetical protein
MQRQPADGSAIGGDRNLLDAHLIAVLGRADLASARGGSSATQPRLEGLAGRRTPNQIVSTGC